MANRLMPALDHENLHSHILFVDRAAMSLSDMILGEALKTVASGSSIAASAGGEPL